mmetsp:Transcript_11116/g.19335  ORF Transcript_11116/g.19335 Transcript_11116/m.19335 type:complete len:156 (+) Transcript_11116:170-637(+)
MSPVDINRKLIGSRQSSSPTQCSEQARSRRNAYSVLRITGNTQEQRGKSFAPGSSCSAAHCFEIHFGRSAHQVRTKSPDARDSQVRSLSKAVNKGWGNREERATSRASFDFKVVALKLGFVSSTRGAFRGSSFSLKVDARELDLVSSTRGSSQLL